MAQIDEFRQLLVATNLGCPSPCTHAGAVEPPWGIGDPIPPSISDSADHPRYEISWPVNNEPRVADCSRAECDVGLHGSHIRKGAAGGWISQRLDGAITGNIRQWLPIGRGQGNGVFHEVGFADGGFKGEGEIPATLDRREN